MSQLQVGMTTSCFAAAGLLVNYINSYLCDRAYFFRDMSEQLKASSFLTQWMHLTVPRLLDKFEMETG